MLYALGLILIGIIMVVYDKFIGFKRVKTVVINRQWNNGSDIGFDTISQSFPVSHPITSQKAQDEAMVAALKFWDPWQHGRHIESITAVALWLRTPGSSIA